MLAYLKMIAVSVFIHFLLLFSGIKGEVSEIFLFRNVVKLMLYLEFRKENWEGVNNEDL